MAEETRSRLNELTVQKLKAVAQEHGVDVSDCRNKRDIIERIASANLTDEQIAEAVDRYKPKQRARAPEQTASEEVLTIEKELKDISDHPGEAKDIPAEDEVTVERNIDQALMMRPGFFEIDSAAEKAWNRMVLGDFAEAMRLNKEARLRALSSLSAYEVYSAALAIRAAETLLSGISMRKGGLDPALKTALAEAKLAFIDGHPRRREETLDALEGLAGKAYDSFLSGTNLMMEELDRMLREYETFGTDTTAPRRLLEIAAQARQGYNFAEYSRLVDDARATAESAKTERGKQIGTSFAYVRAAVLESREARNDSTAHGAELNEAQKALEESDFRRAADLLAAIEKAADTAHAESIKDKNVESRQIMRISSTIQTVGPDLEEASAYGIDVQDGLVFIMSAKDAMAKKDVVAAAKYARLASDAHTPLRKDLDMKRVERGVITHIPEAKCGKCGKESLYTYPDSSSKCMDCGHHFNMATQASPSPASQPAISPAVQQTAQPASERKTATRVLKSETKVETKKEKKGLFRW